jgi:hypothetical protein
MTVLLGTSIGGGSDSGFGNLPAYVCQNFPAEDRPLEVLNLASGYCGHDLNLARKMTRPYRITCTDINEALFEKAKDTAKRDGLALDDLNSSGSRPHAAI